MGRPENEIPHPDGDLGRLAVHLRHVRACACLSYAQMKVSTQLSVSTLARAAGGVTLPTLNVTLAYHRACGGTGDVRDLWERARTEVRGRARELALPTPRLSLIYTPAELGVALLKAHRRNGAPSLRTIQRRAEVRAREFGSLSRSTAHRILTRQTVPTSQRQLRAFLHACGIPEPEHSEWIGAWTQAQRTLQTVRADALVAADGPLSEADALDLLSGLGFVPQEPFRGEARSWTCRCLSCRGVLRVLLSRVADGSARCPNCQRTPRRTAGS